MTLFPSCLNPFSLPKPVELARKQLADAERNELIHLDAAEWSKAMARYQSEKAVRLRKYLNLSSAGKPLSSAPAPTPRKAPL